MKPIILSVVAVALNFLPQLHAQPAKYQQLKEAAETFHAEGSYLKAHEVYEKAKSLKLEPAEARWVQFRSADTLWRSEAATQRADDTKIETARSELEKLVRDIRREEERDRVWVEVQESLGDFWWIRRQVRNWSQAWQHYQSALDGWAGAPDLDLARERYLQIIRKIARPPAPDRYYHYGYYGNLLPLEIAENYLKIALTENDRAHAHYLIAMTLRQQGGPNARQRVPEEFEAALKLGQKTDWYDDALYQYAEWMMHQGQFVPLKDGGWRQEPDYVKALELFRRLVKEFNKGETRYWEQAQQRIRNLTEPTLNVSVAHIFLPDSEIQYHLHWRNVKRIDLALYPVDLTQDVNLTGQDQRRQNWIQSIELAGRERVKSWTFDTQDKGEHKPGNESQRYEDKLPPGAYVLEAKADGKSARDLVLVTDASLVLKTSGNQALVFVCDALQGAPLASAKVKLWERWREDDRWHWRDQSQETGEDGIAVFDLAERPGRNLEVFAAAILNDRQAFSPGNSYWRGEGREPWRIYAFTDRPAYRPNETVNWKFIARRYNGSVYSTPARESIWYRIDGPDGALVKEGELKLNEFGSVWGSLELTETMRLGEYRVSFRDKSKQHHLGNATLFRLEEYKLPEFKVAVQTPEVEGKTKIFRVGDKVEVTVQADYYFGGPVANASVEVLVHQNPFYHYWRQPREFPWFYEDLEPDPNHWRGGRGQGQIVKRETLKTDATGQATLEFETPRDSNQDFEYRIEARVTDASRREIAGNGTVRVTRQGYYVHAHTERHLYRPQERVTVEFIAQDANRNAVQAEGIVKVTRDYWFEIWVAPDGREVKGDELKRLQGQHRIWPPPPERPDQRDWILKFRGYQHDEILTRGLKTDAEGKAELVFTPERDGYYRIAWTSEDPVPGRLPQQIRAETTVWVASGASTEIGYRHGGVQIIADKDTFRAGQKAPVMLVAPTNDRYVLFSVEGEDLYSYQLVHLTGTVKLVELEIEEKHVPNIFLSAALVSDRQIHVDTKQIIVPPVKNFLTVEIEADREQYQPREEGTLIVRTKDNEGKPVSAEVSVALVDESVYYIQSDHAGDPRQFYFGTKRQQRIQMQSTFNQKSYAKLVEGEGKQLMDERDKERLDAKRQAGEEMKKSDFADRVRGVVSRAAAVGGPGMQVADESLRFEAATPAAAPVLGRALALREADAAESGLASAESPAVQVRTDFRSTIVWQPNVVTDADGTAEIRLKYPDSLTGWKATARAVSAANQFGIDDATTRTKLPLLVRLQAPRFFVVGDHVVVSAVVNNNTDTKLQAAVSLEFDGVRVEGLIADGKTASARPKIAGFSVTPYPVAGPKAGKNISIEPNTEARVDWLVKVEKAGPVKLKVTAVSQKPKLSDGMEKTYLAHEHGIEKFIAKSGKARGEDITVKLDIPKERKTDSTKLVVQVTPSLAVTMLDALPYLIDYPYGCTEQTMSRFLPAVITAKTLKDLGLHAEDVMGRVFGGIEPAHAAKTQPKGKKDLHQLDEMVKAGLNRLYDFQHGDGGWGWWKEGESDRWMTAYVVWGLVLAKNAGIDVRPNVIENGARFLDKSLVEAEIQPDMQAWMLHALAVRHSLEKNQISKFQNNAFENLWTKRDELNAYTRALFALSAHHFGKAEQAKILIENLENGVKRDERPDRSILIGGRNIQHPAPNTQHPVMGIAHWGEDGIYWRWSDGGVEATAFALRALLTIDPENKLIEPVTNWLIKNRRGAQWSSTRDTAIVVLAMNDYLRVSGELKTELDYELTVNGQSIAKNKIAAADVFDAPSRFVIDPKLIRDGENQIRIQRQGEGSIYFAAEATFFSLEEPIPPAGNEIFVKREYFKLVGRPTLLKGYVYDKQPLKDGESVRSGERIETVITIEAKNHYEYLVFEDLKPAGIEAVEIRSGESLHARELKSGAVDRKFGNAPVPATAVAKPGIAPAGRRVQIGAPIRPPGIIPPKGPRDDTDYTGRSRWVYQELRDRKVALFIDKLPEGVWEIRYDFRAEVPGRFHALPVLGHAMYVPEIRANSAEVRIDVTEAGN